MFTNLLQRVEGKSTLESSIAAWNAGIAQEIKAAGTDQAKLIEIQTALQNDQAAVAQAILANTTGLEQGATRGTALGTGAGSKPDIR
jgi:hypothetical protein